MTKQEVIKRGIAMELQGADARAGGNKCIVDFYPTAERIMLKQSSQGVVIKVDSEWPLLLKKYYPDTLDRLKEEHFTQVAPLIEEVKDGEV